MKKLNLQLFGVTHFDQINLMQESAVSTASAVASVGVPTKVEFDAVVALVNALKVKINAICKGA